MSELPNWLETIVRSIILLIVLFLLTKWLGKKQLSQLSFYEYITGITIGSIAAEISTGIERNFMNGLYSLLVWAALPFLMGLLAIKNKRARNFIDGKATIVIQNGKINEDALTKEKYTAEELLELLRKKDVFSIKDVEFAILEANGDLSVMKKKDKQPVTPTDLNLNVKNESPPRIIILEGMIIDSILKKTAYTNQQIHQLLKEQNVPLENVYIGQLDSSGKLTVDTYQ